MKRTNLLFLAILFVIGFFLRFYLIPDNLFFGPEQGRDVLSAQKIAKDFNLTFLGPRTDIEGVFYGPTYYYLLAFIFLISGGNPILISAFLILINCLGIFLIYLLGKELFDKKVGLIAAAIYTASYWVIVSSRWLSHPPLAIVLSILFFLFLLRFIRGDNKSLLFAAIALGIIGHVQIFSYPFLGLVLFASLILFWKRFRGNIFYSSASLLLLALVGISYIVLFDLKNNFLISKNLILLANKSTGYYVGYLDAFRDTLANYLSVASQTITPFYALSALLLLVFGQFAKKKTTKENLLLIIWAISPFIVFVLFRHDVLDHYFMSVIPAFILLAAFSISVVLERIKLLGALLFIVVISLNIFVWYKNIPSNSNIFFQTVQHRLKYSDQVKVVDHIYKTADGKQFFYEAYTIPYWLDQAWDYLFWYHGEDGNYSLIDSKAKNLFVIIQEDDNRLFQQDWLKNTVSRWGKEKGKVKFGILEVRQIETRHE